MSKTAKTLARRLNRLHAKKSWRRIAEDYPGVSFATLNRIATSGGDWLPKSKEILAALFPKHVNPAWLREAVDILIELERKSAEDKI